MIQSWRKTWRDDFAFLFVLLAGWHAHPPQPTEGEFAELRDAQLCALAIPRTAAASAVDLGDIEDIHPRNKKDVGLRLARAALAICHERPLEFSGPVFERIELDNEHATLWFSHAEGMHARGDSVEGFAVAGIDGQYFWASARIEEDHVILSCPQVADIRTVRYAWADHPIANIYNAAGLPMMPFRTDDLAYTTAPVEEEYGRLG
jgi:sialate O-acetylesterase